MKSGRRHIAREENVRELILEDMMPKLRAIL